MKTKEQMDELLKGVVVHCTTEEEANQVLDLANKIGYKWRSINSFAQSCRYQSLGESTCYNIIGGSYQTTKYYRVNNYTIITAQEFIKMVNEENKMETKEIKTEVDVNSLIPEGYEIDRENSTFECIKFKKKELTYDDVAKELFYNKKSYFLNGSETNIIMNTIGYREAENCTSEKQVMKLAAINKILNVAKYLNDGWKPNWDDEKEDKWIISIKDGDIYYYITRRNQYPIVYFRTQELAQQAVEILGEDTIRLASSTDY